MHHPDWAPSRGIYHQRCGRAVFPLRFLLTWSVTCPCVGRWGFKAPDASVFVRTNNCTGWGVYREDNKDSRKQKHQDNL